MIQVLEHNYGKGRVTRRQIRAAIKAVRAAKEAAVKLTKKPATKKVARKVVATRSRKAE